MDNIVVRSACIATEELIKNYVNTDKFLPLCRACMKHGKNYACPPLSFEPLEHLRKYRFAHVLGLVVHLPSDADTETMMKIHRHNKLIFDRQLIEYEAAHPGTCAISCGSCELCPMCGREEGVPCRHPDLMRTSFDAYSVDLTAIASELLNAELKWSDSGTPEYMVLIAALLSDKPEEQIHICI